MGLTDTKENAGSIYCQLRVRKINEAIVTQIFRQDVRESLGIYASVSNWNVQDSLVKYKEGSSEEHLVDKTVGNWEYCYAPSYHS